MNFRPVAPLGKGMQLGKKSKNTNVFEQVKGDLPVEEDGPVSLVGAAPAQIPTIRNTPVTVSTTAERESIHITVNETIAAKLSREGTMETFEVKGDLQLRISDASLTQVKLTLVVDESRGAQLSTHPKVDKSIFNNSKIIQLKDSSRGFPANQSIGVMRWRYSARSGETDVAPLVLTAWVNQGSEDTYSITVEYELVGDDTLQDVIVNIPYGTSEPSVSSFDAIYEVSGDSIDWTVGSIDHDNPNGSFEFEAQAESDSVFFPMQVRFSKSRPFVDVDVSIQPKPQTPR